MTARLKKLLTKQGKATGVYRQKVVKRNQLAIIKGHKLSLLLVHIKNKI
jgi:hypothetical protein